MKSTLFFLITLSVVSCTIDNYEPPQLTLSGKILDSETNELVESGGVNAGTVVRLYEGDSNQPLTLNTFPDGTFRNTKIFAGNYSYTAEGPFEMVTDGPQNIIIEEDLDIEIKVIPNVRLSIELENLDGTTATINLIYEKVATEQMLVELGVIWSTYRNPNNFTFAGGDIILEDVESLNLTSGEMSFTIENLESNTNYYIRGSALTENPGNYYNYSTQLELETQ